MLLDYYYNLTPRQLNNIITGYNNLAKVKFKLRENEIKERWEQTRILAYWTVKMNADPKKFGNQTPQQFMPLMWDKPIKQNLLKPTLTKKDLKNKFKNL